VLGSSHDPRCSSIRPTVPRKEPERTRVAVQVHKLAFVSSQEDAGDGATVPKPVPTDNERHRHPAAARATGKLAGLT
jgi:hypothetical protein